MHVNHLGISAATVGLALISVTVAMPMLEQTKLRTIQPVSRPSIPEQAVKNLQPIVAVFPPLPPDEGAPSSRPHGAASRLYGLRLTLKA